MEETKAFRMTAQQERRAYVEALTGQDYGIHLEAIEAAGILRRHVGIDHVYLDIEEDEYAVMQPDYYGKGYVFIGTVEQIRRDLNRCGVAVEEVTDDR